MLLTALLSSLLALSATQVQAGGGGCGGDCPPPDPKEKIAECRLLEIRAVDESTFELDPKVKPVFESLRNFSILFTGDSKFLYNARLKDRYGKISYWDRHGEPFPIDLENLSFDGEIFIYQRWGVSAEDPRPLVEKYVIQVVQEPGSPFARMRLRAHGLYNPKNIWERSAVTVFEAALQCRRFKKE